MSQRAGVWTRLVAGLHGEVAAAELEVYRRAGSTVIDLLDRVQLRRDQMGMAGRSPWDADRSLQFQIAFAWNAFVLQTLGDELIEADYAADGSTVGFLPRVTAEQAAAFYHQVEPWVSRANQAARNPDYESDVLLPAELPTWVEVEPCPRPHLAAMLAAVRSIRGRAEVAVGAYEDGGVPEERRRLFGMVRQRIADADTAAEYAIELAGNDRRQLTHEECERHVKAALEGYYLAGQMLAIPELVSPLRRSQMGAPPVWEPRRLPAPTSPEFDPWCLTDPVMRPTLRQDGQARTAIADLWHWDPQPRVTLDIQSAINGALARGDIVSTRMHYVRCPWAPIYLVNRPVEIGGRRLRQLQRFTYDITAEPGRFERQILVASFEPTDRIPEAVD